MQELDRDIGILRVQMGMVQRQADRWVAYPYMLPLYAKVRRKDGPVQQNNFSMKQITTLALFLSFASFTNAQSIQLLYNSADVVNDSLIVYSGPADMAQMEVDVEVLWLPEGSANINVRRYEVDVQAGTGNYFCWGVCYASQDAGARPVWAALPQHALTLAQLDTVRNFHAYHEPRGVVGTSTYRYVWYNTAEPTDTAWVDIQFNSTAVGIEERASSVKNMQVYPNPTLGNDVEVVLDLNGNAQNTKLVVYNMVGERVRTATVRGLQSRTVVSTSDLSAGLYFITVERNGSALATKRFVVTR